MLKSLLVWLMLLALPIQGLASASMQSCAPLPAVASHAGAKHDHAAMLSLQLQAEPQQQHQHAAPQAGDGNGMAADHHDGGTCSSCAACCVGAAMAAMKAPEVAVQLPHFESIPFDSAHQPTVDLALPERPPRLPRA